MTRRADRRGAALSAETVQRERAQRSIAVARGARQPHPAVALALQERRHPVAIRARSRSRVGLGDAGARGLGERALRGRSARSARRPGADLVPGRSRPATTSARDTSRRRRGEDSADGLPVERGGVELAFAGQDEVCPVECFARARARPRRAGSGCALGAERREATCEPARRARPRSASSASIAELVAVAEGELARHASSSCTCSGLGALSEGRTRRRPRGTAVRTSQATLTRIEKRLPPERLDRAEPAVGRRGGPRRRRRSPAVAPASIAAAISSSGAAGRRSDRVVPLGPACEREPEAPAASITATPPASRQPASTARPSGPVTVGESDWAPPSTSSVPSPPSASGNSRQSQPAIRAPAASAAAIAAPPSDPRNLSGAASARIAPFSPSRPVESATAPPGTRLRGPRLGTVPSVARRVKAQKVHRPSEHGRQGSDGDCPSRVSVRHVGGGHLPAT